MTDITNTDAAPTLGRSVFQRIREMILNGTLTPGTRLQEKAFADKLGVSRTPVREAIGRLVSEGLVTRSGGGTPVVNSISLSEIMEILHVRRLLECEATRQAVLSGKPLDELITLRKQVLGFLEGPRPDTETHAELDQRLHLTLARMAGSSLLTNLIEGLKTKTRIYDQGSIPDRFEPGCHEHIAIIDAVIARDPEAASEAMRVHLTNVRESIISHISKPF
jgi:DNA-binding GntR family transcriptional regulator